MDQVWKGLFNLDPRDPGGFYKKPLLSVKHYLFYEKLIVDINRYTRTFGALFCNFRAISLNCDFFFVLIIWKIAYSNGLSL